MRNALALEYRCVAKRIELCLMRVTARLIPRRLNQRFSQTGLQKASSEVKGLWAKISARGIRENKCADQHKVLRAFALDPTCGPQFANTINSTAFNRSLEEEREWISRKQLLDIYSESEAEDLVNSGAIAVRPHPDNPRPDCGDQYCHMPCALQCSV